jgi:hypothetical protein
VWSNAAAEQQETCGDDAEGGVAAHSEDLHTHMREDRLAGCLNHCMPLTAVQPCRVASQSGADATVRLRASFAFEAAAEDVARCQVPAAASVAPAAHADHDPCHRPQAAGLPPPLPGTWRPAASAATAVGQQGDGEAAAGISAAPPSAADQQLLPVERTATRTSDAVPDSPTAARPSGTTTRTDVSRDVLDQAIQLMQAIVSGGQAGQQGNVDDPEAGDNASPRAVAPPLQPPPLPPAPPVLPSAGLPLHALSPGKRSALAAHVCSTAMGSALAQLGPMRQQVTAMRAVAAADALAALQRLATCDG